MICIVPWWECPGVYGWFVDCWQMLFDGELKQTAVDIESIVKMSYECLIECHFRAKKCYFELKM